MLFKLLPTAPLWSLPYIVHLRRDHAREAKLDCGKKFGNISDVGNQPFVVRFIPLPVERVIPWSSYKQDTYNQDSKRLSNLHIQRRELFPYPSNERSRIRG